MFGGKNNNSRSTTVLPFKHQFYRFPTKFGCHLEFSYNIYTVTGKFRCAFTTHKVFALPVSF